MNKRRVAPLLFSIVLTLGCNIPGDERALLGPPNTENQTLEEGDEHAEEDASRAVYFYAPRNAGELAEALKSIIDEQNCTSIEAATIYLRAHPDDAAGWYKLACDFYAIGDLEKSLDAIDRAIEIEPASGYFIRLRALINIDAQKYADCLEDFRALIESDCPDESVFELCGIFAQELGDFDLAIRAATRAIEIFGERDDLVLRRAEIYFNAGNIDEARADAETIIETTSSAELRDEAENLIAQLDSESE